MISAKANDPQPHRSQCLSNQRALLLVDGHASDLQHWLPAAQIPAQAIPANSDPLQAISQLLHQHRLEAAAVQDLHLIAHGSKQGLLINQQWLDCDAIRQYPQQLHHWGIQRLFLWSCEIGQNNDLIALLSENSGAEVFSSPGRLNQHSLQLRSAAGATQLMNAIVSSSAIRTWQGEFNTPLDDVDYEYKAGKEKTKTLKTIPSNHSITSFTINGVTGTIGSDSYVNGTYGQFKLDSSGNFTYITDRDASIALAQDVQGVDQVDYSTTSNADPSLTASGIISFTVVGLNDTPEITLRSSTANPEFSQGSSSLIANQTTVAEFSVNDVDAGEVIQAVSLDLDDNSIQAYSLQPSPPISSLPATLKVVLSQAGIDAINAGSQLPGFKLNVTDRSDAFAKIGKSEKIRPKVNSIPVSPSQITLEGVFKVKEDDFTPASGIISISNPDPNNNPDFLDLNLSGQYGNFSLASGRWRYELDHSKVQHLIPGNAHKISETFTLAATDGSSKDIVISISGSNDASVFSGDLTGSVQVGIPSQADATGTLTITDVDDGDTPTINGSQQIGNYGTFDFLNGNWRYSLNTATAQSILNQQSKTEQFKLQASDGQTTTITISIANPITGPPETGPPEMGPPETGPPEMGSPETGPVITEIASPDLNTKTQGPSSPIQNGINTSVMALNIETAAGEQIGLQRTRIQNYRRAPISRTIFSNVDAKADAMQVAIKLPAQFALAIHQPQTSFKRNEAESYFNALFHRFKGLKKQRAVKKITQYVRRQPEGARSELDTVLLTPKQLDNSPDKPVKLSLKLQSNELKSISQPVVIDGRLLPEGSKLRVDRMEFLYLFGDVEMVGGAGANEAIGDRSNQQMQLGSGNDTLTGGGGDDLLVGGPGSDLLDGGSDNDVLKGGKGADFFRLSKGNDQILDFQLNVDKLWYKKSPKELWFTQQGDDLLVESRDGLKTLLVGIDKRQALMVDLFEASSKFNFGD